DVYRRKRYIFPIRNCKDMVRDVARAAGLDAPSNFLMSPARYLASIVEANSNRPTSQCPRGWVACNCPEIHGTSCHAEGYDCETWRRPVPCEANYRCTPGSP